MTDKLSVRNDKNRFFGSAVIQSERNERGILAEPLNDENTAGSQ